MVIFLFGNVFDNAVTIPHAVSDDTNLMFSRVSQKRAGQAPSSAEPRFRETRLNSGLLAALCLNGRRAEYK